MRATGNRTRAGAKIREGYGVTIRIVEVQCFFRPDTGGANA
jgi:hypothetical protein